MPTLTIRQFAAAVGVALALGAAIALMLPISADYDSGFLGDQSVRCGSALVQNIEAYRNVPLEACRDDLAVRRAWAWPLAGFGLLVLAGALFVQPGQLSTRTRETGPSEHDSEGPVVQ